MLVPVAVAGFLTARSGFVYDDLPSLRQAQGRSLSFDFLTEPVFGHFAPGHRLVDWSLERFFPFNFRAAHLILLTLFAISLYLFHRLLAELFGRGLRPVVLTLVYGASVIHVAVIQWWASGVDVLPATLLSFLCMLAYVRFFRTGATVHLIVSVAALSLAMMFYVKPIFVPLYLILLRLFVLEPDRPVRELFAEVVREGRIWLAYLIPVGLFAVVYEATYPTSLNEPSVSNIINYLRILWTRVYVPNLFGLWVPAGELQTPMWLAAATTHLALIGLVAWTIIRRRSAGRAWVFFALSFLPNTVIVGATRIGYFPAVAIAYSLRFNVEICFLFAIALGAALGPRAEIRRPVAALVGLAVAGGIALSWWGGYQVSRPDVWTGAQSRIWLDRVNEELEDLRRAGIDAAVVDGTIPEYVVPDVMAPYNSTPEVVPLLDDEVGFDAYGRDLVAIAADGSVRPVQFIAEAGWNGVADFHSGAVKVIGAVPREGPDGLCVTTGNDPAAIVVDPPASLSAAAHLRLEYGAVEPVTVALEIREVPVTASEPNTAPGRVRAVKLPAGGRRVLVRDLSAPRIGSVVIIILARSELCVHRLEVGPLMPRS